HPEEALPGAAGFANIAFLSDVAFEYDAESVVGADLNRDGLPDLVVMETSRDHQKLHVYENRWPHPGRWIGVRVHDAPGCSAMGAVIRVVTTRGPQTAWI